MITCDPCEHRECDDCGSPMIPQGPWSKGERFDGHVRVHARGLCNACYLALLSRQRMINSPQWSSVRLPRRHNMGSTFADKRRDVAEHGGAS